MIKILLPFAIKFRIFLLLLISFSANASHFSGANLTYEYIGPNQYLVTLEIFRDCEGISAGATQVVNYSSASCGVNASLTVNLQSTTDITPLCPSVSSACGGGTGPLGVEHLVYTGIMNLPSGCSDWIISSSSCCRNAAITNLDGADTQSIYIEAELNNTNGLNDNSPTFSSIPQFFGCTGQTINFQQLATDIDGDSLVYSLVDGMQSASSNVTYAGAFNGANPFTVPLTINSITGQITFTPNVPQVAVVVVLIEEYRNGVLIGSIMRDIQFIINACTNTIPSISGINNIAGNYDVSICEGATICFDIFGSDVDLGQNVNLIYSNNIPGAVFTQNGTPTNPSGTFCWNTNIGDNGSYSFTISSEDDACPLIGQNSAVYTINVIPNPHPAVDAGSDISICAGELTTLTASTAASPSIISGYSWTPITSLTNPLNAITDATPTSTTAYTVTLTYIDGCTSTDAVQVTVSSDPTANTFPSNSDVCGGANFLLNGSTTQPGMMFEWFDQSMISLGSGTVSGQQSTLNIAVPAAAGSYIYTLVVTDPISGCSSSDITTLTVGTPPVLPSCTNIYVSTSGSAGSSGTQADPTSLEEALNRAACNNSIIKIATGTYNIDNALTIGSFVTLEGGFIQGSAWTKTSTPGATTINRTTANPEGAINSQRLVAFYGNGNIGFRIQDLTITTANANLPGMSTYAIHLTACSDYTIARTRLIPGNGAMGANGAMGVNGLPGRNGGNGSAGDEDDQEDAGGGGGGGGGAGTTLGFAGTNASGNFNAANNCPIIGGNGGAGGVSAGNGGNGASDANGCGCCANGTVGTFGGTSTAAQSGGGGGGGGSGGEENGSGGNGASGGGVLGYLEQTQQAVSAERRQITEQMEEMDQLVLLVLLED